MSICVVSEQYEGLVCHSLLLPECGTILISENSGIWSCMYRYQTAETCFAGSPFSSAYITRSNIDYDDHGFCPDLLSNLSSFNMMVFFFPCTDWHLVGNRSSTRHDNALSLSTFPGINFLRDSFSHIQSFSYFKCKSVVLNEAVKW